MPADTFSLEGKVAIVTGSGRENGIGAGIARTLARNGASVTIHYLSDDVAPRAEAVAKSIRDDFGVGAALVQADVSTPEGANKVVTETLKQLGVDRVDILVNNAGWGKVLPLLEVDQDLIQRQFGANVYGPIYLTQAAVKIGKMPQGGRVINIGSIGSKIGPMGLAVYAASKAATDSLTTSWAGELGRSHGITVNTIAPGCVETDLSKTNPGLPDMMKKLQRLTEERVGTTDDIADAVLFFASEKSRWITGKFLALDGGVLGSAS